MDSTTRQQLSQCRKQEILSAETCDMIESGDLDCLNAEQAMEALEDNEEFYDLYNFISVNFG